MNIQRAIEELSNDIRSSNGFWTKFPYVSALRGHCSVVQRCLNEVGSADHYTNDRARYNVQLLHEYAAGFAKMLKALETTSLTLDSDPLGSFFFALPLSENSMELYIHRNLVDNPPSEVSGCSPIQHAITALLEEGRIGFDDIPRTLERFVSGRMDVKWPGIPSMLSVRRSPHPAQPGSAAAIENKFFWTVSGNAERWGPASQVMAQLRHDAAATAHPPPAPENPLDGATEIENGCASSPASCVIHGAQFPLPSGKRSIPCLESEQQGRQEAWRRATDMECARMIP